MPDQFSVRVPTLADHLRDTAVAVNEAHTITAALEACPRCGGHVLGVVGGNLVRCAACGWRGARTWEEGLQALQRIKTWDLDAAYHVAYGGGSGADVLRRPAAQEWFHGRSLALDAKIRIWRAGGPC